MAQQVVYLDDLDGTPGAKTIDFSVEKKQYTVDLSPANEEQFHKLLEPYITGGQAGSVSRPPVTRTVIGGTKLSPRSKQARARSADIRGWARAKGLEISDRGRIPAEIEDQYHAAHRTTL